MPHNVLFKNMRVWFAAMQARLLSLSRTAKKGLALIADVFSALLTVWLVFFIRQGTWSLPEGGQWMIYLSAPLIALPVFIRSGLYNAVFRYSGFAALKTVMNACFMYGILFFAATMFFQKPGIPRSIGVLQPLLMFFTVGGSRAMVRMWLNLSSAEASAQKGGQRILIYGAGAAGLQIAGAIAHSRQFTLSGFLDDDPFLQEHTINGVMVYSPAEVESLVKRKAISGILLALPSVTRRRRQEIFDTLHPFGVHILTLPGIEALAEGSVSVSDIKEVDIEDLLGRDPVPPVAELLGRCIKGKVVLVTGAGGSIGSELCRQILSLHPSTLLLLDHSEFNLFTIHQELQNRALLEKSITSIIPLLGNVTDKHAMDKICCSHKPSTLYHAAAYKHVPMVERNPVEGLRNNIFGTLSMAGAAAENGVENFVLISTDKAVRPTNIMGASKRICELVLQAFATEENKTCFSMVRFGNVLGSSGSVVPLFRRQIKAGGPVTITHKDITRYFMTIPEAAQLVIQAGAMAKGGDVFLLDMGAPVKIVDLARRMIELSGLTVRDRLHPEGDIEISITALRPGEKLYEELLIAGNPQPTEHPRIFKAHEYYFTKQELMVKLSELQHIMETGDDAAIKVCLQHLVKGFVPDGESANSVPSKEKLNGVSATPSAPAPPQSLPAYA
jgi:FlaA1/EpsC-like NDP-sugar epimerase